MIVTTIFHVYSILFYLLKLHTLAMRLYNLLRLDVYVIEFGKKKIKYLPIAI